MPSLVTDGESKWLPKRKTDLTNTESAKLASTLHRISVNAIMKSERAGSFTTRLAIIRRIFTKEKILRMKQVKSALDESLPIFGNAPSAWSLFNNPSGLLNGTLEGFLEELGRPRHGEEFWPDDWERCIRVMGNLQRAFLRRASAPDDAFGFALRKLNLTERIRRAEKGASRLRATSVSSVGFRGFDSC